MDELEILNSLLADDQPKAAKKEEDILAELLGEEAKPEPTARQYSKKTRKAIPQAETDAANAQNAERSAKPQGVSWDAYTRRKAELAKIADEKMQRENEKNRQMQRGGASFGFSMPQVPREFNEQNLSEREFARQEMEKQTGKQINREGFGNALTNITERLNQGILNIPAADRVSQGIGNLTAATGQAVKAGIQTLNATQQDAQGQLTPWGAGPNLNTRAPNFEAAQKSAEKAAGQLRQAGEVISTFLPEPIQKMAQGGPSNIMERKSKKRLEEAEAALEFNLAEQDFKARQDFDQIAQSAALKHSQGQELNPEEMMAAQIKSKEGFSGFAREVGETLWMLATDERTQEEFGRQSSLDLPVMLALGGPTGAIAGTTTRVGLNAIRKGVDLAQVQRLSRAVKQTESLKKRLDAMRGQPAAAGLASQYQQKIEKLDKLIEVQKSKVLADMTKPLIAGKSAEEVAAFLASEGLIASAMDLGRQLQEGKEVNAETIGRAVAMNIVTEAAIDAPSLAGIFTNARVGANRDKQTQEALKESLDLGTQTDAELEPRKQQIESLGRIRGRKDLAQAGEIIGSERMQGANQQQFEQNKIDLDPAKTGIKEFTAEEAPSLGAAYVALFEEQKKAGNLISKDGKEYAQAKIKGYTDSSGKITLAENFNRTDYREEHLHTLQSRISKFRKANQGKELDQDFAKEYAAHERNLQKYFARKGISPSQMSATLDEQIAKDLVRGLDTTGEAALQYSSQIVENAPPMPAALRSKLESALGGRQVVKMPTARAAATATQVQPEPEQDSEISPAPTPEPAKPKQTKAEPTAQPTSEFSPDEDADPEGQAIEPTIKGAVSGKGGRAYSEDNTPLPYKWAVIDESEVTASIGANATNQPRDRSRAASQQQIKDLSQRMNFKLASGSGESVGSGAPVLTKDGVILAGNGRIAGMGLGYESNSKAMAAYKADLQKASKKYGIDPAQIQGLERPILVRVTGFGSQDADNVKRWAKVSNQEGAAQYSPAELAKQDAESLNLGEFAAEYPLNHSANASFVRKFVSQIPAKDRAPLVDAKGQLSADGEKRLSRAVLAKAYGEHPIIAEMIEATDPEGTNLLNALKAAAPAIAQAGAKELADKALESVQFLRNANAAGMSPAEYALQSDALKKQDPFVVALAQEFKDSARSYKKLAETLGELAERSTAAADETAPDMMDLMGLAPSEPKGLAQHLADLQIERENSKAETLEGEGFRFSLIGPLLASQEQTDQLLRAQDMEAKGESAYWIWSKTGWFRSPWDDKWKFEVSDKDFDFDFVAGNFDQLKIKNHPLENEGLPINVVTDPSVSWSGLFAPKKKEIFLNLALIQNGFNNTPEKLREDIKSTLLHELQHAIQEKEGFERGANTQDYGQGMPQAVLRMYLNAKAIQDKADKRINDIDYNHKGLVSALVSHGAGQEYKAALEEINLFNQLLELAKNIQRAESNPLYIRKIGDPLTDEAQRTTNWDQYYRRPRSGMFNRTFKSTAHKHAAYSEFFKNYNRLKFEELKKWAQLNNVQWFPENMKDLIATGGGFNKEGLAEYKKQAFSSLKAFIKKFNLKGRENARNTINEYKKIQKASENIFKLIQSIHNDEISVYDAYLRAGGEYEARLVQARAEEGQQGFPLNVSDKLKTKRALKHENQPLPSTNRTNLWEEAADIRFSLETIQVDGKERPTKNSNGQPIAQTEEALKNFWRWFGDSKAVDAEGKPVVFYHGTGEEFTKFKKGKRGIWLTTSEKAAKSYADKRNFEKGFVMPLYAKAENPAQSEYIDDNYTRFDQAGHDSYFTLDNKTNEILQAVVLSPSQLKSATSNTGAFSPDNADIRFSLAAPTDSKEFKNWFKDSKVVNEDGSPKVVYHGSAADFNIFDIKRAGKTHGLSEGTGFYFTENEGIAKGYVKDQEKGRLFEVFLSIQKPIEYNQKPFTRAQMQKVLARIAELEAQEYGYSWQDTFLSNMVDTYSFKSPQAAAIEAAKSFDEATALDQIGSLEAMNIEESIINQAVFESLGYDGFKAQGFSNQGNPDQTIWVAMFPEQIKSATDNIGSFDPKNPDIRFSLEDLRGVPHPDRPENFVDWSMDALYSSRLGSLYDTTYQWLIDEMNPLRRIEQQHGLLDRQSNPKGNDAAEESPYIANTLRFGQVRESIESAEKLLRPILKRLKREGKTLEEAGEFLYAQHAPDYNREMAKINPPRERVQEILTELMEGREIDLDEASTEAEPWLETLLLDAQAWLDKNGTETEATALDAAKIEVDEKKLEKYLGLWRTQEEIDAGLSGMSTAEAKEIVKQGRQSRGLVALSQAIAELRSKMRAELLDSDLISPEQAKGLEKYPNYVPLKGWEDETIAESMEMAGRAGGGGLGSRGLSITGSDIRSAGGRVTKASNPLGHFLADYQRVFERGSRNRVANKLYDLAEKYPEGPWQIWEPEVQRADYERKVKGSKSKVSKRRAIGTPPSNAITFKREGEAVHLQIFDKALLRALKTLDQNDGSLIEKVLGKYNRFMGALITSYNPEFMITNAIRDAQMVATASAVDQGAKIASRTMLNYGPAIAKIMKAEFSEGGTPDTSKMGQYWREFKETGAMTGYTITDKAPDALKKLERQMESGIKGEALEALRAGFRNIEAANTTIESMGRLAYYAALRDQGFSNKRAAYLAKNLTVNFNRKGLAGKALNSWWLFFNAAIQGNARFLKFIKTPKGLAAISTLAAVGLLSDLGNGLFGPDDDEREMKEWDKKPMHEKSMNLIFMRGKDDSFDWRFPVGYGINVPFVIGQYAGQAIRRQDVSAADALAQTALAAINGFSPVRWTNNMGQTLSPTIIRLPVDLAANENFAGQEIAKSTGPWDTRPESQKGTDRQSTFSKSLADLMNESTGGSEYRSGWIDQHPAQIDYVIQNSLGGVGAFLGMTAKMPSEMAAGDLTAREIPFVRKVISQRSDYANQQAVGKLDKELKQIQAEAEENPEFAKSRPELVKLAEEYEDLQKQAKKARKEAKDLGGELDPKTQEKFWGPFLKRARDLGVKP